MARSYSQTPLGRLLQEARGDRSRPWAETESGIPAETIERWETGYTPTPPLAGVAKLAEALGVPAHAVLAAARGQDGIAAWLSIDVAEGPSAQAVLAALEAAREAEEALDRMRAALTQLQDITTEALAPGTARQQVEDVAARAHSREPQSDPAAPGAAPRPGEASPRPRRSA